QSYQIRTRDFQCGRRANSPRLAHTECRLKSSHVSWRSRQPLSHEDCCLGIVVVAWAPHVSVALVKDDGSTQFVIRVEVEPLIAKTRRKPLQVFQERLCDTALA